VRRRIQLAGAVALLAVLGVVGAAIAGGGGHKISERLTGYEEVPALSTTGSGKFQARIARFGDTIRYRLSYRDLESAVTQAHIHFGQEAVNGGVSVWLCANNPPITTAPAGTQPCPPQEGTISGVIERGNVVGPGRTTTPPSPGQGIEPGEFEEFLAALRAGVTYANVHTANFAAGEIRAQLDDDDH
jgi:CHRD domain